jgi:hypothetical protein
MLFHPKTENRLDALQARLQDAEAVTPSLMSVVIADACPRISVRQCADQASRIDRLIKAEAWTESAIALLALELSPWGIRRLVFDGGTWHCSCSDCRLPEEIADSVDSEHENLALAILSALVEAKRRRIGTRGIESSGLPLVRQPAAADTLCCDNFT